MSVSHALSNALTGLTAASRMAEVVSSNLANALTDGYARRVVDLSADSIGGRGAGVRIDGVRRIVDPLLLFDRRQADAGVADAGLPARALAEIEAVLGRPGEAGSLADRIARLESALLSAGADPSSEVRLGTVLDRLHDLAAGFRSVTSRLTAERQRAEDGIAADVRALNEGLARIAALNDQIGRSLAAGDDATGLMDRRQREIDRIAEIVPVRELQRPGGKVALITAAGQFLLDSRPVPIGFSPVTFVAPELRIEDGDLGVLTVGGVPMSVSEPWGGLGGGRLEAGFALRDRTLPGLQDRLDALAADLAARFADPLTDPTLAPGDPGLLTDGGLAVDSMAIRGLAGRLAVAASVDPAQGGALWRLREGVAAPGPTAAAGAADQIERWMSALAAPTTLMTGGSARTAGGHAAALVAALGAERVAADDMLAYRTARQAALAAREQAGGVDSDQEMQMLLRIEQAYAANARVIEAVDEMIRRLMEI